MIFWVGILIGGLFVWLAVTIGFYETWAMLFNIVISIYLAIFVGPILVDIIPAAGDTPYGNVLAMISIAVGAFLILHCISYIFITGQFSISFPRIFETLGAGFLGFLAGFLVWSFLSFLICITPIFQQPIVKELGFGSPSQQANISNICWWCNLVHKAVACQDNKITSEEVISGLLKSAEKKARDDTGVPAEPNEPAEMTSRLLAPHPAMLATRSPLTRGFAPRFNSLPGRG